MDGSVFKDCLSASVIGVSGTHVLSSSGSFCGWKGGRVLSLSLPRVTGEAGVTKCSPCIESPAPTCNFDGRLSHTTYQDNACNEKALQFSTQPFKKTPMDGCMI